MTTERNSPVDARGIVFEVGQTVARAAKLGAVDGVYCQICEVTKVADGKVYLDGSAQALKYPGRVAIIS